MKKNIEIIGAPTAFGQRKLGVNFGPDIEICWFD